MNKYLMMSAAAVLAGTASTAANAVRHSFAFATNYGGGSYCDGGIVYQNGSIWSWAHTDNNCGGGISYGLGVPGKAAACTYPPTGAEFKCAVMSDTYLCQNDGLCSYTLSYALPKKIKNGEPWLVFVKLGGTTAFLANWGLILNVTPRAKGKISTISKLKELLAVHRNAARH